MKKKAVFFHPIIAPYRIDLFNTLAIYYDAKIVLYWRNLKDQKFDYDKIEEQFLFTPEYIIKDELGARKWFRELWRILSTEKPEIVFVSEYGPNTLLTLAHRFFTHSSYKIVCITDDSYNFLADDNHFSFRHKKAIDILAPHIDEFINVEPKSAEWYQNKFGKGLYFPIIVNEKKAESRYRRILPISEQHLRKYYLFGKKILLFVGRLVEIKNVQQVIKVLKGIEDPELRFIIIGSGEYENALKKLAADDKRIIFVGRLEGDDLYAWYNIANCFILPSYQEAFGAVTNEALLGGCRCLISKNAGSQCLIENGVNGVVFDPYNNQDLKIKLLKELSDADPVHLPLTNRQSLMTVSFDEMIKKVIGKINSI